MHPMELPIKKLYVHFGDTEAKLILSAKKDYVKLNATIGR